MTHFYSTRLPSTPSSGQIKLNDPDCERCNASGAIPGELVCALCDGRGQVRMSVWARYRAEHPSLADVPSEGHD